MDFLCVFEGKLVMYIVMVEVINGMLVLFEIVYFFDVLFDVVG